MRHPRAERYNEFEKYIHTGLKRNAILLGSIFKSGKVIDLIKGKSGDYSRELYRKAEALLMQARGLWNATLEERIIQLYSNSRFFHRNDSGQAIAASYLVESFKLAMDSERFELAVLCAPTTSDRALAKERWMEVENAIADLEFVRKAMRMPKLERRVALETFVVALEKKQPSSKRALLLKLATLFRCHFALRDFQKAISYANEITTSMIGNEVEVIYATSQAISLKMEMGLDVEPDIRRFWLIDHSLCDAQAARLVEYCRLRWLLASFHPSPEASGAVKLMTSMTPDMRSMIDANEYLTAFFLGLRWALFNSPADFERLMEFEDVLSRSDSWQFSICAVGCYAWVIGDEDLIEKAMRRLKAVKEKNCTVVSLLKFFKAWLVARSTERPALIERFGKLTQEPNEQVRLPLDQIALLKLHGRVVGHQRLAAHQ